MNLLNEISQQKQIFNSSSCFIDLLYAKKYIDQLKGTDKVYVDKNHVVMIGQPEKKPHWLSFQNNCGVVSFDGHNIVSTYFPKHKVLCGNCYLDKCELIKIPHAM